MENDLIYPSRKRAVGPLVVYIVDRDLFLSIGTPYTNIVNPKYIPLHMLRFPVQNPYLCTSETAGLSRSFCRRSFVSQRVLL